MKWEEIPSEDKIQGCAVMLLLMGIIGLCATAWGWIGFWGGITAYALMTVFVTHFGKKP